MNLRYPSRQFGAAESRHDNVRQQDFKLTLMLSGQLQRFRRAFRFQHFVAVAAQYLCDGVAQSSFIIGNQYRRGDSSVRLDRGRQGRAGFVLGWGVTAGR